MGIWLNSVVKRWPGVAYCVLVYGLLGILFVAVRWLIPQVPPTVALLIGSWLPNIAGVLVTGLAEGRPGLLRLFRRLVSWRVSFGWYCAALFLPAASVLLAVGWHVLRGNPPPSAMAIDMLLPNAALNLILGPLGEELGWRGTLLPRLRLRTGVFAAGLVVGLIWGPYHLPAWLMSGMPQVGMPIPAFLLSTVALSIFLAWLYERTGGSLLVTCLAHWAINFVGSASGIYSLPAVLWSWAAIWWMLVAAIVLFERSRLASPVALRRQS